MTVLKSAAVLSLALVLAVAVTYSYSAQAVVESLVGFLILLAAAVALWTIGLHAATGPDAASSKRSIGVGLVLGLLWAVEILVNNLLAPPLPTRDIVDDVFWAAIALAIVVFAAMSAYRTARFRAGLEAGVWTGFASGLVACCVALSVIVFGMHFITTDPLNVAEWAARAASTNAPSMAAYFAFETFAGALMHLVVLGFGMGAVLGVFGGAVGRVASLVRRPSLASRGD
jgi:hypothetical protein